MWLGFYHHIKTSHQVIDIRFISYRYNYVVHTVSVKEQL